MTINIVSADFWEEITARLGDLERVIGGAIRDAPDERATMVKDLVMRAAIGTRALRDTAIIEQWERERRNSPVKRDRT